MDQSIYSYPADQLLINYVWGSELTAVLWAYLTHCHNWTLAISAVAASSYLISIFLKLPFITQAQKGGIRDINGKDDVECCRHQAGMRRHTMR